VPESIATSVQAAGPEAAVPLDLADQIRQTLAA
jgi:hypothetical protein